MIEKDGVHRLTQIVVATEGERQIAHSAADMTAFKILAYPTCGADKVEGITVVLTHAGGDGEDVGVKDDVGRIVASLAGQQVVSTPTHLYLTLIGGGLSLLIECHNNDGGTQLTHLAGTLQKDLFALFQRYGVDYRLALYALEALLYNIKA